MSVLVVGAGVAGLTAARDLALRGLPVTVVEASDRIGGAVAPLDLADLRVDAGADSFATRSTAVSDLVGELGLGADVVLPEPRGSWLQLGGSAVRSPSTGMLGVPGALWSRDLLDALGAAGVLRAALDRLMPPERWARTSSPAPDLASLVRRRQGQRVLDRLVTPVVTGVHTARPEDVDVDTVLPGLRTALSHHRTLGGAVASLRSAAPAGSAVAGLRGGMHRVPAALAADLRRLGVQVLTGTAVEALRPDGARWAVTFRGGQGGTAPLGLPPSYADVVLAVPEVEAVRLLWSVLPAGTLPAAPAESSAVVVTLLVASAELDAAPRGTGVLVAPGTPGVRAKALTHATAKWSWLAEAAGPGRHVLRLSYGGAGHQDAPERRTEAVRTALADASRLLDVRLGDEQVLAAARVRWTTGLPRVLPGHRQRVRRLRSALDAVPGVWACGAWLSGTGLAAVVPDARRTAAQVAERRADRSSW